MSTLCTTTVDELQSQYIPKRVQRSSSFRHDIPPAAPVTHRRGGKVRQRQRGRVPKPKGGGSPVRYLEKSGGAALLHNEWMVKATSSHPGSTYQISHTTFQLMPIFFHIYLFGFEVGYACCYIADIMYFHNFVYIGDLRHSFSFVNLSLERSTPLDSLLYYSI